MDRMTSQDGIPLRMQWLVPVFHFPFGFHSFRYMIFISITGIAGKCTTPSFEALTYYSYKEIVNNVKIMVTVKKSALRIDFGNVEKISFYIPIYDNTQFILQSRLFWENNWHILTCLSLRLCNLHQLFIHSFYLWTIHFLFTRPWRFGKSRNMDMLKLRLSD